MRFVKAIALFLAVIAVSVPALAQFDASRQIAVVSREEGSGTRGAFVELTGVMQKNEAGQEIDRTYLEADFVNGTSLVITTVASNPWGIGYASISAVQHNGTVKPVRVNGVEATQETILSGAYPVARPFNLVMAGELADPLAKDFVSFIMSREGQEVVAEDGLVPAAVDAPEYAQASGLSGSLTIGGSTSVAPVMELLAEAYMEIHPGVTVDVQATGSTAGVTNALNGSYDIGMASRALKDSEAAQGASAMAIGVDGIAVIVNLANPVEDLTLEQVRRIFTGEAATWAALGE
ncbi:MAG TPA: substrate-binding domain-containing protein [Candidatus Limnocylindria bacterium]|nr:substrate-binding domain-containing protein [Candidatus Limnocylindria bacterium]